MKVDSSIKNRVIQTDGIDIHTEYLQRPDLLAKLTNLVSQYRIVRLTSPASSGKSSLLDLFQDSVKNSEVIWINCLLDHSCFQLLAEKGIDLEKGKYERNIGKRDTFIFLDDAQAKYSEVRFWDQLIKGSSHWMPSNVRFIISSTHLLSGGTESPVEFKALPRLERGDFLLTADESNEFLELPVIGLPQTMKSETFKQVLIRECGGLIGALRQSIDFLKDRFAKDAQPPETALLQFFLSDELLPGITRCFGSAHSAPIGNDFKLFLKKVLVDEKPFQNGFANPQDDDSFSSLKKAGILVELPDSSVGFSSSLAKRYYFKWIFPNRSRTRPSSLRELLIKVVSNMSSTVLKNSTFQGDFPKEAVFQHLFIEGLALYTPPECSICPELSKIFPPDNNPNSRQAIAGEIDFYLNGSLRWGIELLVNGEGIGEHLDRFSPPNGKYVALAINDYAIVDFRRNTTGQPTSILKHRKRASVFFMNDDYSVAQCLFGEDPSAIEISLAH